MIVTDNTYGCGTCEGVEIAIPAGDWEKDIRPQLEAWWEEHVREAHDGDDEGVVQTATRNFFYERRR